MIRGQQIDIGDLLAQLSTAAQADLEKRDEARRLRESQELIFSFVREAIGEISLQLDRIEKRQQIIIECERQALARLPDQQSEELQARIDDLDLDDERDYLRQRIAHHRRYLQKLRLQEAHYGPNNTPVHILTEIEDLEIKIERLEAELDALVG